MKIPITGPVAVVLLLLLALATSGCESTPLLAPSGSSMTLLASPVAAAPDHNKDPEEEYYFTTVFAQLLSSGSGGTTDPPDGDGGTAAATATTPLVGVSVTFSTSGGNLRFNSCAQGVCSLDGELCPGGTLDCVQPTPEPVTVETDSSGVAQVAVAVSEDDPASITVTALSGALFKNVSFGNSLGAPNEEPIAGIAVAPESPADASSGSVTVIFTSESTDPDGDPITCYEWTFSDNIGAAPDPIYGPTEALVTQDYEEEQRVTVSLRVSDDPDAAASCDANAQFSPNVATIPRYIVCTNLQPTAAFTVGPPITTALTVEYEVDGQDSEDPGGGAIQNYEWDCDNGQDPTGVQTSCTYTRTTIPRSYEIELVVTDFSVESDCELQSLPTVQVVTVPALDP